MRQLSIPKPGLKRPNTSGKIPKEAVLYTFRPETQYTCEKCLFQRDEATHCTLFSASEPIKPNGSCGFWIHFNAMKAGLDINPLGAVTKLEAGYQDSKNGFSCKRCKYFDIAASKCQKVDENSSGDTPGIIHANACCNAFEADEKRGELPTDKVNALMDKLMDKYDDD